LTDRDTLYETANGFVTLSEKTNEGYIVYSLQLPETVKTETLFI